MQYINLKTLKIENTTLDDKIEVKIIPIEYDDSKPITELFPSMGVAVKNALESVDRLTRPHRFDFEVRASETLTEESFESAVKLILAAFFGTIVRDKGRPRERRLDVPENLKSINCNMSLLKCAINYQTLVDKFQVEIYSGDLRFILVGGYDE